MTSVCRQDDDEVSLEMPPDDLETGVLPMEIKKLVDRRREVKKLMKNSNNTPEEMMQVRRTDGM